MRRRDRALPEDEAQKSCRSANTPPFVPSAPTAALLCARLPSCYKGRSTSIAPSRGKKLDNIARDPRVSLYCVGKTRLLPEEFSTLFESAVVTGRASMVEDEAQKVEVLRAICQKYAASNMHNFEREVARSLHRTGICKSRSSRSPARARRTPRE